MSLTFDFFETPLKGLVRIQRKPVSDSRGSFCRHFCTNEFREIGLLKPIVQVNLSLTINKGTIRGMHFQNPPATENKIVSCIRGEVIDVAVDIRKDSETFLMWHAETLNDKNQISLNIPEGFAHGFQALTDDCQLLYLHTGFYSQNSEGALNALDPLLAIDWPLEFSDISERDRNHPLMDSQFEGISLL